MPRLKIYTDENVDVRVAEGLRRRSIKAFSALEKGLTGVDDQEHLRYAAEMQAIIFTHDHHFLALVTEIVNQGKTHHGVIFVEMNKLSVGEIIKRLVLYAELVTAEEMMNRVEFL